MRVQRTFLLALSLAGSLAAAGQVLAPALASAASAAPAAPAAPAPVAAAAGPAGTAGAVRSLPTWRAAQRAAGFGLLMPGRTYGLRRFGGIRVGPCFVPRAAKARDVFASYGPSGNRVMYLDQNDHGRLCAKTRLKTTALGTYRIHGVTARLVGVCGHRRQPSCRSAGFLKLLTWRPGGRFYQVGGWDEPRRVITGFAAALHRVR
jgi:hypothetical protein